MGVCIVCNTRFLLRGLNRRLAVPEYRAMTGFWPWLAVRVCDGCLLEYDRDFQERFRLLAPQVLENDEPIAENICLVCGTLESAGPWHEAGKWVGRDGAPARRARFRLCHKHRDFPYAEGIVIATNLGEEKRLRAVLDELPAAGAKLLARVEGWQPDDGHGPPDALDFTAGGTRDEAADAALRFWQTLPEDLEARGAWLGPVRKDYRLRYRLDLVRDCGGGRRETLVVVRLGNDRFATYRLGPAPANPPASTG